MTIGALSSTGRPARAEQRGDAVELIGLHVDEVDVRAVGEALHVHALEEQIFREEDRDEQKGAEPEREEKEQRLIVRAVEIGDALPQQVGPCGAGEAARGAGVRARSPARRRKASAARR